MRILLLTYRGNPYCGGQGIYAGYLAREWARMGHEVHVIHGPPYAPEEPGIHWHRVEGSNPMDGPHARTPTQALRDFLPLNLLERMLAMAGQFPEMHAFSWRAFLLARRLFRQMRFDVVLDNQTLGWGLLPMQALGVPLVATLHHPLTVDRQRGFDPPSPFMDRLNKVRFYPILMQRAVVRRMPLVVTVSHASAEAIIRDFGVPRERLRVVYNGIDTDTFRPRPEIARVPGRVVFVGNLEDPNKGGRFLLHAMGMLPRAHLVVATGGVTQWDWLHDLVRRHGLGGRLVLHERLSRAELAELYATAQVAVSPSLFEGFGFPAGEALACGVPLVAASGSALSEVVGDAGLLVPPANPVALAEALRAVLQGRTLRERLAARARPRVQRRFRWAGAATQMIQVFQEAAHAHH